MSAIFCTEVVRSVTPTRIASNIYGCSIIRCMLVSTRVHVVHSLGHSNSLEVQCHINLAMIWRSQPFYAPLV